MRLSQVVSVVALGLKPHMEPLFDLLEQKLAELRLIPRGHPVLHDDHYEDGSDDNTARVVDAAFRGPADRNQRSDRSY